MRAFNFSGICLSIFLYWKVPAFLIAILFILPELFCCLKLRNKLFYRAERGGYLILSTSAFAVNAVYWKIANTSIINSMIQPKFSKFPQICFWTHADALHINFCLAAQI